MEKLDMHTANIADKNFEVLSKMFPNAITETIDENGEVVRAIDADVLRQEISCNVVEGKEERYQFTWPDKKKSIIIANQPVTETLRLQKEKSERKDGTGTGIDSENIYIEGDNLVVLKLLRETYLGKIRTIYIDPPYNTGSDLIYEDDFSEDEEYFLHLDGQKDWDNNRLVKNNDTNGRFHTDWLNMIYQRIKISRDLLAENGLIFISIDDHEVSNLEKICNEIFGASNKVSCLVWQKKTSPDARMDISAAHDYILVYVKNMPESGYLLNALPYDESRMSSYTNPDNDPRGAWASVDITGQTGRAPKSQFYEITTPSGTKYYPPEGRCWAMAESTFKALCEDNRIWFGTNGNNRPRQKKFLSESEGQRPWTWWDNKFASYNQASNKELMRLFDGKLVFDNPKPVKLISRILELSTQKDEGDIVLDFFAGSSTTAHAVMEMNSKDGGNRRYICIQLPQELKDSGNDFKANNVALEMGYENICDIGEERIRRAAKEIKEETHAEIDYGFRVFKVDTSNMKSVYYKPSDTEQTLLDMFTDNIKPDRTPEDLLFQVMLELDVLLSSKIEETEIAGKKVFSVADGYLIACFDKNVTDETVKAIANKKPYFAVFRDNSMMNDSVATNFDQIFANISPDTIRKVL